MFLKRRLVRLSYPVTIIRNTYRMYSVTDTFINLHVEIKVRYTDDNPAIFALP